MILGRRTTTGLWGRHFSANEPCSALKRICLHASGSKCFSKERVTGSVHCVRRAISPMMMLVPPPPYQARKMGPFDGTKKIHIECVSLEWVSQVAEEFEESEFEIQTSELGDRRTDESRATCGHRGRLFSECGMCARTKIRWRRRHSDRGYLLPTYYTASLSHLRTMLPKSSSCPKHAQRHNHAT